MCTAFTIDLHTIACMHASRADRVKFSDRAAWNLAYRHRDDARVIGGAGVTVNQK
jgi:hypothetical protein